jgi:FkbM family methyltransferase
MPGDTIIDGGAFDGDTAELFLENQPDLKALYLFEPSSANMIKAKDRLKSIEKVEFYEFGLSDKTETVSFSDGHGETNAISADGNALIKTVTIDDVFEGGPVNFIKLDIEGAELRALRGAQKTILRDHPTLAICVYHNARDFWEIPKFVLGLRNDYKLNLRHYTEGWSETVMYFTPVKN